MYSLVLMAAIGTGPGTAGADGPGEVFAAPPGAMIASVGCTGCTGCTGYASCHGCSGHHFLGHKSGCCGGFLGHKHSCHGCCGGSSCFGSCSGFVHQSAWGNCHGCCGGFGPTTYYYPAYSTPIVTGASPFFYAGPPVNTPPVVVPPAKEEKKDEKKDNKKGASLKFNLPAGAVLFVDGVKTPGEGEERSFFTPPLEAGQKYFYDVRAEIAVDGKTVVEEKRVIVESGAAVTESFPKMIAAVAAAKSVASK